MRELADPAGRPCLRLRLVDRYSSTCSAFICCALFNLENDMRNIIEALVFAVNGAVAGWQFARHLQRGGNPDVLDF